MSEQAALVERAFHLSIAGDSLYVKMWSHPGPDVDTGRPVLVLLHEALGSVGQWKSFPRELCAATGCDAVAYDRAGHGQSSAMREARHMDFYEREAEEVLLRVLEDLTIRKPVLFGHSDGATIALAFAARFPEVPAAVVSIAAHVVIEEITLDGIRAARQAFHEGELRQKLLRYHGDKTDAMFSAWADNWLHPLSREWNMLEELRRITCPLLVIQGENDAYGSRLQVDAIADHVAGPHRLLWLPACGHLPHLQARPRVIAAVAGMIDDVSRQFL
jgi:pimeloyl-ACP methyl ester carboxylesterase